jgi:hypothetical protein
VAATVKAAAFPSMTVVSAGSAVTAGMEVGGPALKLHLMLPP